MIGHDKSLHSARKICCLVSPTLTVIFMGLADRQGQGNGKPMDKLQSKPGTGPHSGRQRDNIGAHRASAAGMRQMTSGSSTPLAFRSVQLPMTCPPRHSARGRLRNYGKENRRGTSAPTWSVLFTSQGHGCLPDHLIIATGVPPDSCRLAAMPSSAELGQPTSTRYLTVYCALMFAALIIGHHFSISAL